MEVEERSLPTGERQETARLVNALQSVRDSGKKSNIRSTDYYVDWHDAEVGPSRSAVVQEAAEDFSETERSSEGISNAKQIKMTSWKTQEFAYRKTSRVGLHEGSELPTLARGLFTTQDGDEQRIVVRGYDKFFNVGELHWTRPEAIAAFSIPPYELTFKENGCIIFIAALSPQRLIVTSKHSLGSNESHAVSHAQKGEEWLQRHLNSRGKEKAELAAELWHRNETAVAELCDDNFEEHVLNYPAERTGLHLHGLNANQVHFRTRSIVEVEKFAQEWGFLPTRYMLLNSLTEVERTCREVAESGSWQGVAIEGFVVRTRLRAKALQQEGLTAPPYHPGQTWFYKVKFDEPYLMYRDWRELTRKMLSDKGKYDKARRERGAGEHADMVTQDLDGVHLNLSDATIPKSKKEEKKEAKKAEMARRAREVAAGISPPDPPQARSGRPETKVYIKWCYGKLYGSKELDLTADASLFQAFEHNKGIIKLREDFLAYLRSPNGAARLNELNGKQSTQAHLSNEPGCQPSNATPPFTKTLLVPIAIPGCGKTVLANALKQLIPDLGHTQSDDVQSKKTAPTFLRNILSELDKHDLVFADRNNHLFKHRNEIVDSIRDWQRRNGKAQHRVRLVALAWSLDALPLNALHRICSERIVKRGENHQSLRSSAGKEHEQILWNFLRQLQPFGSAEAGAGELGHGDAAFDSHIVLSVNVPMEENLAKTYGELAKILQLDPRTATDFATAIDTALAYKVAIRKEIRGAPLPAIRYYGLAIDVDIVGVLAPTLSQFPAAQSAIQRLVESKRVIPTPHVTLIHSGDLKLREDPNDSARQAQAERRWNAYAAYASAAQPPTFDLWCDLIAWDDKAVALGAYHVRSPHVADLQALQSPQWRPHITLGTFSDDIRPFEANRVLRDADAGRPNVHVVRFGQPLHFTARIQGMS